MSSKRVISLRQQWARLCGLQIYQAAQKTQKGHKYLVSQYQPNKGGRFLKIKPLIIKRLKVALGGA